MKCAPHNSDASYTCFSKDQLVEIAKHYNTFTKICKDSICFPVKRISDIETKSRKQLHKDLESRFRPLCKSEGCWIDLDLIDRIPDPTFVYNLKYFTFKPRSHRRCHPDPAAWA